MISLFSFKKNRLKGAGILTVTAGLSYLLGLVRDRLFAHHFGAGIDLDAYNAAFIVPDLLLNIFVAGALQAAFVPLFTRARTTEGDTSADTFASSVLTSALGLIAILASLAAICMPLLAPLIAPGIQNENRDLLIHLSRLLLISPILFAASNTLGGMLVSKKTYVAYGLSPVLYNLGIISGILLLAPRLGIQGVAVGTIAGGALHLMARIISVIKSGFRFRIQANWRTPLFKKLIALMIPKMIGHPAEQISFWAFTAIASTLAAGSITMLSFARNFMSVPVSLFGISVATAAFPFLSEDIAQQRFSQYKGHLINSIKKILLLTVPSAIVLFFGSKLIVGTLIGSGKFDEQAVATTASLLTIFALSVPLESMSHVLARAFYAWNNTLTPVVVTTISLVAMIGASWALSTHLGIQGLGWGFFIGSALKNIVLMFLVIRKLSRAQQNPAIPG